MAQPQSVRPLVELFCEVGRELQLARGLDSVLPILCERTVALVPGAEHAAISRGRRGRFETVGATSELPPQVDQIQYELRSGPCVDAALTEAAYRSGNLAADERWPVFGERAAAEHGVNSMLSTRLFLEGDDLVAALNVYSTNLDAFDTDGEVIAMLLATHASAVVISEQLRDEVANLERALESNRGIGMAIGVLMNQYKVTRDEAFDLLRMASQHGHRKLVDIAWEVAETGALELPPIDQTRRAGNRAAPSSSTS